MNTLRSVVTIFSSWPPGCWLPKRGAQFFTFAPSGPTSSFELNSNWNPPSPPGAGDTFETINVAGTLSGQFIGLGEGAMVGNFGGEDLFISYAAGDGNGVALFTVVPEPGTLLLALFAIAGLGFRRGQRICA